MSGGIILESSGQDISKQGLVLTSIRNTFISSSNMKSKPNISKLLALLPGSRLLALALITSVAIFYIE